ncbi:MAG: DUF885 family protein, partial [Ideonella sp.]|nr:DUF885 family protein [Ideonella sp.]
GWSREQAVAYMAERLSLSRETIEGEVDRYAALPAQALGYQIGGLKFGELRQRAQAQLGARFKHRDFHAAVMSAGAVTLAGAGRPGQRLAAAPDSKGEAPWFA